MRFEALIICVMLSPPAAAALPCAVCHRKIADAWMHTGMARSLSSPSAEGPDHPITVYSPAVHRYYQVFRGADGLEQSEYELDAAGPLVYRVVHRIEFAVGSGTMGRTYIIRRGDWLFQAPLSWYARTGSWALSPGYERQDQGFNRPILPVCMSCHGGLSGRGVGCQDCHGDGQAHAASRGRDPIVNPAKLQPSLAEDICMRCHQDGDARVLQPGRHDNDFQPGAPLSRTVAIFKLPAPSGRTSRDLLEHHASMRLSRCFTASAGKLGCITCHDPHTEPPRAERAAWYRSRCLGCHTGRSCTLPRAERGAVDDCAACHMPKRPVEGISHAALTLHRIVRRPGQPAPRQAPNLRDLIYFNGSPGDLPRVTLLQAYAQLLDRDPAYEARYLDLLDVVRRDNPRHPFVLAALGRKALREGDPRAIELLTQAAAEPVSPVPFQDLAEALTRAGRKAEAVSVLRRALERFPFEPVLLKRLIAGEIALKRYADARAVLERYLEIFPDDQFMREMLRKFDAASTKPVPDSREP